MRITAILPGLLAISLATAASADPSPDQGAPAHGWGAYVAMNGRSVALARGDRSWRNDDNIREGDVDAGLGWRGRTATVLVGYSQHDAGDYVGPQPLAGKFQGDPGAFGLGFAMRVR